MDGVMGGLGRKWPLLFSSGRDQVEPLATPNVAASEVSFPLQNISFLTCFRPPSTIHSIGLLWVLVRCGWKHGAGQWTALGSQIIASSRAKNNLFHSLHYALYLFLLWVANHRRKFVLNCVRTKYISLFIPRKAFPPPVIWGFNHRHCWHWGKIAWFTGECFDIFRMIRKLSNHGELSYSWRKKSLFIKLVY